MWMMGYNDEFNMPDSFNGRKLRPLIPRPAVNNMASSSPTPPCITRIHGSDFFALNHHLATMAEQNKREFNIQPSSVVVSSRWNPTPEQLRTLEELYRRGTRTPSAEQIQHITAQLRRYGKIEGKNVFYWFQNHKARERQKRRRQMESPQDHDQEMLERKDNSSGSNRVAGFEVEQNKNWAPSSTHCSSTPSELQEANTVQETRATKAAAMAECRSDGWVQYEELQQRRHFVERNATWQKMQLSCPPRPTPPTTTTSATTTVSTTITTPTRLFKNFHHHQEHLKNIFLAPPPPNYGHHLHSFNCVDDDDDDDDDEQEQEKEQTLELFPLRSENTGQSCNGMGGNYQKLTGSAMDATSFGANHQFFEFLPLKN